MRGLELNLSKKVWNADWDASGFDYTLPSGLVLRGFSMLDNKSRAVNSLGSLKDGYVFITTKAELEELIGLTWEETLKKVQSEHPNLDIEGL